MWPESSLTQEQLDALARIGRPETPIPLGDWDNETQERVYAPLVKLELVTMTVTPHPTWTGYDVVHYEATDTGRAVLERLTKAAS